MPWKNSTYSSAEWRLRSTPIHLCPIGANLRVGHVLLVPAPWALRAAPGVAGFVMAAMRNSSRAPLRPRNLTCSKRAWSSGPRSQGDLYGCVTPAKATRSATVKFPGVDEGRIGMNPPTTFR